MNLGNVAAGKEKRFPKLVMQQTACTETRLEAPKGRMGCVCSAVRVGHSSPPDAACQSAERLWAKWVGNLKDILDKRDLATWMGKWVPCRYNLSKTREERLFNSSQPSTQRITFRGAEFIPLQVSIVIKRETIYLEECYSVSGISQQSPAGKKPSHFQKWS